MQTATLEFAHVEALGMAARHIEREYGSTYRLAILPSDWVGTYLFAVRAADGSEFRLHVDRLQGRVTRLCDLDDCAGSARWFELAFGRYLCESHATPDRRVVRAGGDAS